jgi:hypothetical protein
MDEKPPQSNVAFTTGQMRNRHRRNYAVGLSVASLAALFYAITIVKLGPNALRPMP